MTCYLSAKHVRKTYGQTVALNDASLELHQGEIFTLLGPNGAGKTTLIKVLATLLTKDAGKVNILGYDFVEIEKSALSAEVQDRILQLPTVFGQFERSDEWASFGVNDVMSGAEAIIRTLRKARVQAHSRHHTVSREDAFIFFISAS